MPEIQSKPGCRSSTCFWPLVRPDVAQIEKSTNLNHATTRGSSVCAKESAARQGNGAVDVATIRSRRFRRLHFLFTIVQPEVNLHRWWWWWRRWWWSCLVDKVMLVVRGCDDRRGEPRMPRTKVFDVLQPHCSAFRTLSLRVQFTSWCF